MKVDRLRCARLKKMGWAHFLLGNKRGRGRIRREISPIGVTGLFEMCVRGTHTRIILYYLFIILSTKGGFCRMFQRSG